MFTEDRDKWDVAVGVLVVTLVIASLYALSRMRSDASISDARMATEVRPTIELPGSTVLQETIALDDGASHHAPGIVASVYECFANGQTILSDHPCGPDAKIRDVTAPNRMNAQDTRYLYRSTGRAPDIRERSSQRASSKPGVCDSIEEQIDQINARTRRRYTSQEGELFRNQLRQLHEARYEARCIR